MANIGNDANDQEITDRKPKREGTLQWVSLPVELRLMILHILTHERRGLASYASVFDDGLTLELSTQSSSDSEHWFKNDHFGVDVKDEDTTIETGNQLQRWHDPKHGWINGQQVTAPGGLALLRLFESVDLNFPEALPKVHAVTSFILRRQVRRRFTYKTLQHLLDKLPQLERLAYEPWRVWATLIRQRCDREYKYLIEECLPKRLKRISVFEDFNEDHITPLQLFRRGSIFQIGPIRHADPTVGAAFAYRSLDLEQLYVSYLVDAHHFFQAFQPLWTWDYLQPTLRSGRVVSAAAALQRAIAAENIASQEWVWRSHEPGNEEARLRAMRRAEKALERAIRLAQGGQ
ncbi:hypothetical protein PT974_02762 [Cladobotryum mycophilum]|uniref:DUF6546 domain-containing protein n=1 Tax=Cladobotryum mycophilum TaxID=491253 RepID=A0ABR0SYZ1_9HYPO